MSSSTERQPRWQITHEPSGHTYFLYERPSRTEAEEIMERLKRNNRLVTDLWRTPSDAEKEQIEALRLANVKRVASEGTDISQRCLGLTKEQIDKIPSQECMDILIKLLQFTLEESGA